MYRWILTFHILLNTYTIAQDIVYPIQMNGKWGFINKEGEVAITPQFDYDQVFLPQNGFMITEKNYKYGLLTLHGELISDPQFDQPPSFQGKVSWVQKNEKWGMIDRRGIWLIEPAFETVYDFVSGYAIFEKNGRYGLADSNGMITLEPRFSELSNPSEGLVAADAGDGWGYVDMTGKYVIPPRFGNAYDFHDGFALVIVNYNRWRIIDKRGNFATEKEFDYLGECGDGLFYAQIGEVKGIADHTGEFIFKSLGCRYFSKNLIQYEENEKIGFRNLEGRILLEPQFVRAGYLGEGWIAVVDGSNRQGFMDTLGNMRLMPQTDFHIDLTSEAKFNEGRIIVQHNRKFGVIDRELKWIVKPKYEMISPFRNGWAAVNRGGIMRGELPVLKGGKYGFIDLDGGEIVEPSFEEVLHYGHELALVKIGSSKAYVNKQGKIIWKQ